MDRRTQIYVWYVLLALLGVIFIQSFWSQAQHLETVPYSEFERDLKEGRISEVVITSQSIRGTPTRVRSVW